MLFGCFALYHAKDSRGSGGGLGVKRTLSRYTPTDFSGIDPYSGLMTLKLK
ncbi:hypothetical protein [Paludibacter sp. 221]|uniref:hypothetical protein n=1 Tax=Paludibacter sp. 221 TaxID=2302939 RepID=UPI0013D03A37|nr:hypothetical protein [Paludibacter sp. 221]